MGIPYRIPVTLGFLVFFHSSFFYPQVVRFFPLFFCFCGLLLFSFCHSSFAFFILPFFFFNPKRWKIGGKRRRNGKLMRKNGGTTQKKRAKNSKVYKTSKHGSGRPRRSSGRRWLQIGRKEPRIVISPRLKCASGTRKLNDR